jgi:phosphatidate phosphatase PAH1
MKSLIVFDLDGTLAESKSAIDAEMATLLGALLAVVKVARIFRKTSGWTICRCCRRAGRAFCSTRAVGTSSTPRT